jgi:hypothetical protein
MTFIESARIHSNVQHSARSLGNARKALAEVQRGLTQPVARGLGEEEISFLEQRCTVIELALESFGVSN